LQVDIGLDMGDWLLSIPVLLMPLAFRRNVLLAVPVMWAMIMTSGVPTAQAGTWQDLWQTADQQASSEFTNENYDEAARRFEHPEWQAGSLYKNGEFERAAAAYKQNTQSDELVGLYNEGNALAKSGQLQAALDTYDKALGIDSDDEDALFNRELVAQLLKEQEEEEASQQGEDEQQDQSQQGDGDQQDQSQQGDGEQQEQSQQGDGEQQNQSQQGDGEQQDQSQQGDGEQQEQSQQGDGELQEQSQQGDSEQQDQSQQGDGEQQEQSQQGEGEQQDQSQQGEGEQQDQSQQGDGEQQDQSQQGDGEQQHQSQQGDEQQQDQ